MDRGVERVDVPGPYQYTIWVICSILEITVVVCTVARHSFRRYFLLNLYMVASLLADLSRYWFLTRYGFTSKEYIYAYFYSDAVLTICLYLALLQLYSHVFDEMKAERYLIGATLLLLGTALFSYLVVQQSTDKMVGHFVYEVSQNLYFVGLMLTYILWGAVFKLRETRAQLIQLVLSLGIYFSAFAANYALQNLHHDLNGMLSYVTPLTGVWLPAAWSYAFLRTSRDARLVPSHMALSRR